MEATRIESIGKMVEGIAKKEAYKFTSLERGDLENILWQTILEEEEKKGKELDLNLLAVICFNKLVDVQRYEIKRNHFSFDPTILDHVGEKEEVDSDTSNIVIDDKSSVSPKYGMEYASGSDFHKVFSIKNLIESYEIGSKERIFIEFWMASENLIEDNFRVAKFNESTLAKLLGYSGTSSGGFKSFRWKMRKEIAEYFDRKDLVE